MRGDTVGEKDQERVYQEAALIRILALDPGASFGWALSNTALVETELDSAQPNDAPGSRAKSFTLLPEQLQGRALAALLESWTF